MKPDEFGVEVRSSGGYNSITAKYELARHIIQLDMPVVVLHLALPGSVRQCSSSVSYLRDLLRHQRDPSMPPMTQIRGDHRC